MRRHALIAVLTAIAIALVPAPAWAADVEVRVLNVADAAGSVRVQLCPEADWLKDCALSAHAPARPGVTVVTLHDVPPGLYGVIAHHDSNDDTEVNRNIIGLPTEGIGFSRDAPIRLGPPRFEDARLLVGPDGAVVPITLHFEHARAR